MINLFFSILATLTLLGCGALIVAWVPAINGMAGVVWDSWDFDSTGDRARGVAGVLVRVAVALVGMALVLTGLVGVWWG